MTGYPKGFYELLLSTLAVLFVTGLLLIPTVLDLRLEWDVTWRLPNDQRLIIAAIHVAVSFLTLAFGGALWTFHMRRGWTAGRNKITGTMLVTVIVLLLLSGVGIYYLGGEFSSIAASLTHTVLGVAVAFCFAVHFVRGRKSNSV